MSDDTPKRAKTSQQRFKKRHDIDPRRKLREFAHEVLQLMIIELRKAPRDKETGLLTAAGAEAVQLVRDLSKESKDILLAAAGLGGKPGKHKGGKTADEDTRTEGEKLRQLVDDQNHGSSESPPSP